MPKRSTRSISIVGDTMLALRESWGLTQQAFGERLGYSREWVARAERSGAGAVAKGAFEKIGSICGLDATTVIEMLKAYDRKQHADELVGAGRMKPAYGVAYAFAPLPRPLDERLQRRDERVGLRRVPYFDFRVSASGWSECCAGCTEADADGYVDVPTDAPIDAFAIRLVGDCMEPTFADGAIVICVPVRPGDSGQQFTPGKAYYFQRVGEQCTFKNVFYEPPKNRYRLESLNKKYKPLYVPEQEMQRMSRAIKIVIDLT